MHDKIWFRNIFFPFKKKSSSLLTNSVYAVSYVKIGAMNGCTFMTAVTNSDPPAHAISYYQKNGWTEVKLI